MQLHGRRCADSKSPARTCPEGTSDYLVSGLIMEPASKQQKQYHPSHPGQAAGAASSGGQSKKQRRKRNRGPRPEGVSEAMTGTTGAMDVLRLDGDMTTTNVAGSAAPGIGRGRKEKAGPRGGGKNNTPRAEGNGIPRAASAVNKVAAGGSMTAFPVAAIGTSSKPEERLPGKQKHITDVPFHTLSGLTPPTLRAIETAGYTFMTVVQKETIPVSLAGRDVLARAKTG